MAGGDEIPPTPSSGRSIGELSVSSGADVGRMITVADGTVLGRDTEADVVLQDPSGKLSRRHARISLSDGTAVIEDLGSTNGTYLNDEPLNGPQPLHAGDRIRIGDSEFSYVQ